jgi:hypothetical protein
MVPHKQFIDININNMYTTTTTFGDYQINYIIIK